MNLVENLICLAIKHFTATAITQMESFDKSEPNIDIKLVASSKTNYTAVPPTLKLSIYNSTTISRSKILLPHVRAANDTSINNNGVDKYEFSR